MSFVHLSKMITPRLQSTNVKIALQKEKSKQLIQILNKQSSRMGVPTLEAAKPEEKAELNKTSLPFLQPKKIDLGLNIDKAFYANARATQEFNAK